MLALCQHKKLNAWQLRWLLARLSLARVALPSHGSWDSCERAAVAPHQYGTTVRGRTDRRQRHDMSREGNTLATCGPLPAPLHFILYTLYLRPAPCATALGPAEVCSTSLEALPARWRRSRPRKEVCSTSLEAAPRAKWMAANGPRQCTFISEDSNMGSAGVCWGMAGVWLGYDRAI